MESGNFVEEGMNKAAYIREIQIEESGSRGYHIPTRLQTSSTSQMIPSITLVLFQEMFVDSFMGVQEEIVETNS